LISILTSLKTKLTSLKTNKLPIKKPVLQKKFDLTINFDLMINFDFFDLITWDRLMVP